MSSLNDIFELTDNILPSNVSKSIFFCEVEENAYEIFYYAYMNNGIYKQCYELVEEGELEEIVLDSGFDRLADFIRKCATFDPEKRNVVTLIIDGINEKVSIEKYSKKEGMYKIKKDWKLTYIVNDI